MSTIRAGGFGDKMAVVFFADKNAMSRCVQRKREDGGLSDDLDGNKKAMDMFSREDTKMRLLATGVVAALTLPFITPVVAEAFGAYQIALKLKTQGVINGMRIDAIEHSYVSKRDFNTATRDGQHNSQVKKIE